MDNQGMMATMDNQVSLVCLGSRERQEKQVNQELVVMTVPPEATGKMA